MQSVHNTVQINDIGGDKELGASDYFAQNLFVYHYEDYEEDIINRYDVMSSGIMNIIMNAYG